MIGEWTRLLEVHSAEWGLPAGGRWNFLLHNNYQPNFSGMNLFWFRNGGRDPLVITKIFPDAALSRQEFERLQDAYACAPGCVPRPLGLYEQRAYWTLWMSGVPGSRLSVNLVSDSGIDQLSDALARVHAGGRSQKVQLPQAV